MPKNWPTSHLSLIERLQQSWDPKGWDELCEAYYRPIYYFLQRRYGLSREDCEDTAQEVLIVVVRDIVNYDQTRSRRQQRARFRTWVIWRIRSVCSARAARRARRAEGRMGTVPFDEDIHGGAVEDNDPEEWIWQGGLLRAALDRVRKSVSASTYESFVRYVIEGEPASEVAGGLGISVASVYTNKRRMIARIRAELTRIEGYAPGDGEMNDGRGR